MKEHAYIYVYLWRDHGGTGGSTDLTRKERKKKKKKNKTIVRLCPGADILQTSKKGQVIYINIYISI